MPVEINNAFEINTIELRTFEFKQLNPLLDGDFQITLKNNVSAAYLDEGNDKYLIILSSTLDAVQLDNENEHNVYSISSEILGEITTKSIEHTPKVNFAAMLYSYLRPLVAQMTVFAKLPPLDLPPLNFKNLEIVDIKQLRNENGENN